jgi:outer membrane lipoprotein carrier protein
MSLPPSVQPLTGLPGRLFKGLLALGLALAVLAPAHADGIDALHRFVQEVKSLRAGFTQTVTSPDGAKKKTSTGSFEFQRPGRFRFEYTKPYEQTIVADGLKLWLYDPDLAQVTVRSVDQALGATPAALLAGGSIEKDFQLSAQPDEGGLQWVLATPRVARDNALRSLRVGWRGNDLAVIDITDGFGQRSRLDFGKLETNLALPAQRFQFTPPAGVDVLKQ